MVDELKVPEVPGSEDERWVKNKDRFRNLLVALGCLVLIFVILLGIYVVQFDLVRQQCQDKLDYWVDRCADKVPSNMPVLNVTFGNVSEPEPYVGNPGE